MSKCLMHLYIPVPKYPHFIDILNARNNGSMNNVLGEIEMGSFIPLVFSTVGGMGHAATVFFLVSLQMELSYSSVMSWLQCRISYSPLLCF